MKAYKIIRKEDTKTIEWSGGTTRELFIYPENSNYKAKDFLFRLSVATIEVPTSIFTPLEGIRRTTLILDGEIELTHDGHYSKTLKALEQDSYDGGWKTSCKGTCADFNLMLREHTEGTVQIANEMNLTNFNFKDSCKYLIYVLEGTLTINQETVNKEDAVVFDANDPYISLESDNVKLILCEVQL